MRARAQALFFLISSGFGYLFGYLASGWWKAACTADGHTDWRWFWGGLGCFYLALGLYFVASYQGVFRGLRQGEARAP